MEYFAGIKIEKNVYVLICKSLQDIVSKNTEYIACEPTLGKQSASLINKYSLLPTTLWEEYAFPIC